MSTKYKNLYETLKKQIENLLDTGSYMLPPERELAHIYGLSRQTVRQALSLLENENLIQRVQGGGSYLTGIRPSNHKNKIALILSEADEYIFPKLVTQMKHLLGSSGFVLDIFETHGRYDTEREVLSDIENGDYIISVAEPICCTIPTPNVDMFEKIISKGTNFIFLFGYYPNLRNTLYVKDDNFGGALELGHYLLSLSHKNIACLFQKDTLRGQERFLGYSSAMIQSKISLKDEHICWFTQEDLTELEKKQDTRFLNKFIKNNLSSCSAIICFNDIIAYWLIRELSNAGIHVPQDISVVSFDNSYLSDLSKVRISGMSHNENAVCDSLYKLITDCLTNKEPQPVVLQWSFVDKESCTNLG